MFNWFPYTNFHNLNLDWILNKLKDIPTKVSQLENDAGYVTAASAGIITSVNGQTGDVVLDASDVGALPDTYSAPVDSVNGQTGTVVLSANDVNATPSGQGIPSGGTTGQILTKNGNDDYDVTWRSISSNFAELWVNSAPSAAFAAQTLSIDVTDYSFLIITYKLNAADSTVFDAIITIDGKTHVIDGITIPPSAANITNSRNIIPGNTIEFTAGLTKTVPTGTRATDNNVIVPVAIYGVKF